MDPSQASDSQDAGSAGISVDPAPSRRPPLPSSGWKPPSSPWDPANSAVENGGMQQGESSNIETAVNPDQNISTVQPEVVSALPPVTHTSSSSSFPPFVEPTLPDCAAAPPQFCATAFPFSAEAPQFAVPPPGQPQPLPTQSQPTQPQLQAQPPGQSQLQAHPPGQPQLQAQAPGQPQLQAQAPGQPQLLAQPPGQPQPMAQPPALSGGGPRPFAQDGGAREAAPPPPPAPRVKLLPHGEPPKVNDVPIPRRMEADFQKTSESTDAWEGFLLLKKNTEDSVFRMMSFYDQIVKLQLTHDQETMAYREATEGTISNLRKSLESISLDYKSALTDNERLQNLARKKEEELKSYESSNYDLTMRLREAEQRCVHVEDRAKIAETGWKMVEIRQRELEMSLDHTTGLVAKLREELKGTDEDKARALQAQYELYEENRRSIVDFYNQREKQMVHEFNESIIKVQEAMELSMKEREEHLSKCWKDTMHRCQQQHDDLTKELDLLRQREAKELETNVLRIEKDKERWYDQYRNEMTLLEQRHKEREQHVLTDIARRERELGEREERMRLHRLQEEQESKVAYMAKEAELKGYYQKIVEDINLSFGKEREKLAASHRDQIHELSQLHLNNERELERMHRDKEREMAQRYRIAGYEVDDRKSQVDLQGLAIQSQSALLSKFDAIEVRQKERAEKARLALQATSGPSVKPE